MRSTDAAEFFDIEVATIFDLDAEDGLLRRSSPDRAEAPRLFLAACASGQVLRFRDDVPEHTRLAIERVSVDEPVWDRVTSVPRHLDEYTRVLAIDRPVAESHIGLLWTFPERLEFAHTADVVHSDSDRGRAWLAAIEREGVPDALVQLGFVDPAEFWPPWNLVLDGVEVASIAFSAGVGVASAEVGLVTVPAYRGRGFGAAAVAGWASHPALRGKALFYGTDRENLSSQRVVERLGLSFVGASLSIR